MTQPTTQPQPATPSGAKSLVLPWIIVLATVTMIAARWTGYAALPYLVIFAPLLTWVGVTALAVVLAVVLALFAAIVERKG